MLIFPLDFYKFFKKKALFIAAEEQSFLSFLRVIYQSFPIRSHHSRVSTRLS